MSNKETVLDLAYYCNGCEQICPEMARDTREKVSIICTRFPFCQRVANRIKTAQEGAELNDMK